MKALNKEGILAAMALKKETIELDGGSIIVTEVTAEEYMEVYGSDLVKNDKGEFDGGKFVSVLATRCIVNEDGSKVFADEDAEVIRMGSSRVYHKITAAVNRVNGLTGDEAKK